MSALLFDRLGGSEENKVPPPAKTNGSGRDNPNAVNAGNNPSNRIRPSGVCLSPCSALDWTSKDDPERSGLAVRTSQCASGHIGNENSDVRGRNGPQASREGGIDRNPPPLGVGRFKFRIVDAFAGIGGIRLGFETAANASGDEIECSAAIEFDKDSRKTYELNFGHAPQYSDITAIGDMSSVPDHDVLVGGFPCQVFSRNGKFYNKNDRTLGDDDRKNLVTYLFQILAAKKPRAFLFENVKEILTIRNTDGTKFFDTIVDNANDLGYMMLWAVLDSADFGLPQQRRRVYMVGFRDSGSFGRFYFPSGKQGRACIRDILEPEVDQKYLAERLWSKRKNVRLSGTRMDAMRMAYESHRWVKERSADSPTSKISPVAIVYGDTPSGAPRQQDKLYSQWGISPTVATFSTPTVDVDGVWRLLTPRECARLMGLPDSFLLPANDHLAYKQVGNGVAQNVIVEIAKEMFRSMKEET